jgi:hypothetical protein
MSAYVGVALDRACAEIVSAPTGVATLHRESYAIGGPLAVGALDSRDGRVALIEAVRRMPAYGERWTGLDRKVEASLRRGVEGPRTPLNRRGQPLTAAAGQCERQASASPTTTDARRLWQKAVRRPVLDRYPQAREKAEAAQ